MRYNKDFLVNGVTSFFLINSVSASIKKDKMTIFMTGFVEGHPETSLLWGSPYCCSVQMNGPSLITASHFMIQSNMTTLSQGKIYFIIDIYQSVKRA